LDVTLILITLTSIGILKGIQHLEGVILLSEILTAKEAGEMLKVSDQTIRAMIRQGKIKAIKIGRAWRIKREEIERIIEKGDA
jgi:excisionase family DNA binding protein